MFTLMLHYLHSKEGPRTFRHCWSEWLPGPGAKNCLVLLLCVIDIGFHFLALRWVNQVDLHMDQAVYNFLHCRTEKQFLEKAKQHSQSNQQTNTNMMVE